ncbi:MAG: hypothetical protein ACQXXH_06625 [Candidatus Bathyarchaeia archaeon]|jgi:hypothetical protein|nr:hypothetical protein [Candidatus Bathyarchaeota archaeon A05DMB-4]MDH7595230.1 hypothetical protein [Candidatus Bathyarchaeota archaeon]
MFEFGDVKFRPVEKEDLKLMHQWENDFELIMYSRAQPMNLMNMAQIENSSKKELKKKKSLLHCRDR